MSWFDTHPPLKDRIRRIVPNFNFSQALPEKTPQPAQAPVAENKSTETRLIQSAGEAAQAIAGIPSGLIRMTQDPLQIEALLTGLLGSTTWTYTLTHQQRLNLISLSAPLLRQLDSEAQEKLLKLLEHEAMADGVIEPFELLLLVITESIVQPRREKNKSRRPASINSCTIFWLSYLAKTGTGKAAAEDAFNSCLDLLPAGAKFQSSANGKHAWAALRILSGAQPMERKRLVDASLQIVKHDQRVTGTEQLLLTALKQALDAPGQN